VRATALSTAAGTGEAFTAGIKGRAVKGRDKRLRASLTTCLDPNHVPNPNHIAALALPRRTYGTLDKVTRGVAALAVGAVGLPRCALLP